MEAVVDLGEQILQRVACREVEIARLQALTAADLLEFEDVRAGQAAHLVNLNDRALAEAAIRDEVSLTVVQPVGNRLPTPVADPDRPRPATEDLGQLLVPGRSTPTGSA